MDPAVIKGIATGVAAAFPVALIIFAGAWWTARARSGSLEHQPASRARLVANGAALAAAFAVGWLVRIGAPALPPREAAQWLPFIALAALAWGCVECWGVPGPVRWIGRADILIAGVTIVALPLIPHKLSQAAAGAWVGAFAAGGLLLWFSAEHTARRAPGRIGTLTLLIVAGCGAVTLLSSGSVKLGESAGFLASALGAAFIVSLARPRLTVGPAAAAILSVVLTTLVFMSMNYATLRLPYALLIAAALPLSTLADVGRSDTDGSWKRSALRLALAGIPSLIAAMITAIEAAREAAADPYA